jgi:hypothetical protein
VSGAIKISIKYYQRQPEQEPYRLDTRLLLIRVRTLLIPLTGAVTTRSVKLTIFFVAVLTGLRHNPLSQSPARLIEQTESSSSEQIILYISTPLVKNYLNQSRHHYNRLSANYVNILLFTKSLLN